MISPTKVGYIITAIDRAGLDIKYILKNRPKIKPSVVLCPSVEVVNTISQMTENIWQFYEACRKKNLLVGCILPWKFKAIKKFVPKDKTQELIMDAHRTSCFVTNFGEPSEIISECLWTEHGTLLFASSANPSSHGNQGRLLGATEKILQGVNLIIEADDYVAAQQPNAAIRCEQGVIISFVDEQGGLTNKPVIIRKGLALDQVILELITIWNHFEYRHGLYY